MIANDRAIIIVYLLDLFFIAAATPTASCPLEFSALRPHVRFRVGVRYTWCRTKVFHALASLTRSLHQNCTLAGRCA